MAKKEKNKNSEIALKAGDVIETEAGEKFELDEESANSLNEQMNDAEESKEELAAAPKKTGKEQKGTFRFNNKIKK